MFYKIVVNGRDLGIVGHRDVENFHLSMSGDDGGVYVAVNALCNENGGQYYYSWLQEEIRPGDKVEVIPLEPAETKAPLQKLLVGRRVKRKLNENIICDFCYRDETEAGEMIHLDQHRPTICSECVQVCSKIFEQWMQK